jgi:hypothetical protein
MPGLFIRMASWPLPFVPTGHVQHMAGVQPGHQMLCMETDRHAPRFGRQ